MSHWTLDRILNEPIIGNAHSDSEHVDKLKEFAEKDAEETGLSTGQWTNNKAPCLIEDEHGQEECGTYVIDTIEQLT